MKKFLEILKKCPLFAEVGEEGLLRMLSCLGARPAVFEKKQTVLREGDPARQIGIVLSGSVQVIQVDYDGNRTLLSEVGAGHLFNEAFACAEVRALPVSVVAGEATQLLLVDCAHILHTCERNCDFHRKMLYNLMKDLATKTVLYHERVEVTARRTTREKLLAYLSAEARRAGSRSFTIPFDRQELADYLEVDRSGLSAEIGRLRREGVLESVKNRFVLL